jgi:hypothetical protein
MGRLRLISELLVIAVVVTVGVIGEAATQPLVGCYERTYDATHLAAHKEQLVVRATLSVRPPTPEMRKDETHPIVATGDLKIWVHGRDQSFDSLGACGVRDDALLGSVSAAEADQCKVKRDGVHDCRTYQGQDAGSFLVEAKPEGVLVVIHERLELVPAPYDGGPFLYLSPFRGNGVTAARPCSPSARSSSVRRAAIAALEAKIETLQAEITKLEAVVAGQQADLERERHRANALWDELLKAGAHLRDRPRVPPLTGTMAAK